MARNAVGQYQSSLKTWDHVGNIIPDVEHSEGIRPAVDFKPATYLPVQFFDKNMEDWVVILPGKGVALDGDGRVVPAGLAVGAGAITYTQNDIDAGVISVVTGLPVVAGGLGPFVIANINGAGGAGTEFLGRAGVAMTVSTFIGVASYPFFQWAGDGSAYDTGSNPSGYRHYNYNTQHAVAVLCDYVLRIPIVPASHAAEAKVFSAPVGVDVSTTTLGHTPVARNTMRTPFAFTDAGSGDSALFVNEVGAATNVVSTGDWHVDLVTGVVTVYKADGSGALAGVSIAYSHYATVPTGANVSAFACALGTLLPGDLVEFNVDSNFIEQTALTFDHIVGQIIAIETHPQDCLDRVKTAFDNIATSGAGALPGYDGQFDQMPGTATGGMPDLIHYAGAANQIAIINLISR